LETGLAVFVFVAVGHPCAMLGRHILKPPIFTTASNTTRDFFREFAKTQDGDEAAAGWNSPDIS
jgi:hypothetical protein